MTKLLLASGSIRRKGLLEQIGVHYESASMDIDESVLVDETANDYVLRLAREKAAAGLEAFPDKVVLAADTTVVVDGEILAKPETEQMALEMLRQLSGKTHQVLTGIAVTKQVQNKVEMAAQVVVTDVDFATLTDQQIRQYIKTGEPMDKAGAYGIQGKAALFVDGIKGSYSNVVGLPLAETGKLLQQFDIPVWQE
jgi:septum formation protein